MFAKSPGSLILHLRPLINWPQAIFLAFLHELYPHLTHQSLLHSTRFLPFQLLWVMLGELCSQPWLLAFLPPSVALLHNRPSFPHSVSPLRAGTTSQSSPWFPSRAPGNEPPGKWANISKPSPRSLVSELTTQTSVSLVREQAPWGHGLLLIHLCILSTWHTVFRKCGGRR